MHLLGLTLECTCGACPEQYDVFDAAGKQVAYFRLRHGWFYACVPDVGGTVVYECNCVGDGVFATDSERSDTLTAACKAVLAACNVEREP